MKASRRNKANAEARNAKRKGGPPVVSKYLAKSRGIVREGNPSSAALNALAAHFNEGDAS